jgi:hypothetical protein
MSITFPPPPPRNTENRRLHAFLVSLESPIRSKGGKCLIKAWRMPSQRNASVHVFIRLHDDDTVQVLLPSFRPLAGRSSAREKIPFAHQQQQQSGRGDDAMKRRKKTRTHSPYQSKSIKNSIGSSDFNAWPWLVEGSRCLAFLEATRARAGLSSIDAVRTRRGHVTSERTRPAINKAVSRPF